MKTIVIPDIHHKIDIADAILAHENPDRAIFLGDYFDDFGDSPEVARRTAEWLVNKVHDNPKWDFLLGNHDIPYLFPHLLQKAWCTGYTQEKAFMVSSVIDTTYGYTKSRMPLHTTVGPWLLTHAGFSKPWWDSGIREGAWGETGSLADVCEFISGVRTAMDAGEFTPLLGAGRDRGGEQKIAGITWCDWDSFVPVPGIPQLVGHTPHKKPQFKGQFTNCESFSLDLDTHLWHYAVYRPDFEDWEVRSVADINKKGEK